MISIKCLLIFFTRTLGEDVVAPASIALKKLQVDSFESLDVSDGCKQKSMKREVLKEYITKEVLSLLRKFSLNMKEKNTNILMYRTSSQHGYQPSQLDDLG